MKRKSFYLQVVYYSVKNMCKYFVQSPVWNKQPYVVTDPSCHSSLVGVALALDIGILPPSTPDLELCLKLWTVGWLWLTWRTWNSFSFTWGKNSLVWVYCFLAPEGDIRGWKLSRHHLALWLYPTTVGQPPMLSFDLTHGGYRAGQDTTLPLGAHQRAALKEQGIFSGSFIVD